MTIKPLCVVFGILLLLGPSVLLLAQDSAAMSPPVIRTTGDEVVFITQVQDLVPGNSYRLGIACAGSSALEATLELRIGDELFASPEVEFTQEYTSHWWGVDKLKTKGFELKASDLPDAGQVLTFRVAVPREIADKHEKLYIFVSRDYGNNTWYPEDGVELDQSYW
jgi:hypothetical protein